MRLILALSILLSLPVSAVNRTGENSIKIPLSPGSVRILCPTCLPAEDPQSDADITVCDSGCDHANTTEGITAAIAAAANGDIIEWRTTPAGSTEEWAARLVCSNQDGTALAPKQIRVRDGDTITLDTETSATGNRGLVDFNGCSYWIVRGNSTGSSTDYLSNGLRIGDRTHWNYSSCPSGLCFPNRRGFLIVNSTHLAFVNFSATGGAHPIANLVDGNSDRILFKTFVFDRHGANNQDGLSDGGDLTRFYGSRVVSVDGTFSHGGHQNLAQRGPYQIYRRVIGNGDWRDLNTGYSGNHAANFNGGQKKDERATSESYALQSAFGPALFEDSIFTGTGFEPEHDDWNQVTEMWGVGTIVRGNYSYGQAEQNTSWMTQCSPSGSGAYMNQYMDGDQSVYHNTVYGSLPNTGGGNSWSLTTSHADVCQRLSVLNNVFMGIPLKTPGSTGTSVTAAWAELRAKVPLGSYTNGWKGSRIMGNLFGGLANAVMQISLAASGGTTGAVSMADCSRWPANVCNNVITTVTFANGAAIPVMSKSGLTLSPSSAIGLADAPALTTVSVAGSSTSFTLTHPWLFKDDWGLGSYTFGGHHTEYGDCIAVSPTAGGAVANAVVTRITAINTTTGVVTVTPGVTRVAGSNVWKATDHGDGTCGAVWDNRGAVQ